MELPQMLLLQGFTQTLVYFVLGGAAAVLITVAWAAFFLYFIAIERLGDFFFALRTRQYLLFWRLKRAH
jgi:uncharacterized membrane protein YcgQ (UPF0703/DUF1980 family)